MLIERQFFKDGKLNQENLIAFVKEMRKYPGLSHEDAALLAASKYDRFNKCNFFVKLLLYL